MSSRKLRKNDGHILKEERKYFINKIKQKTNIISCYYCQKELNEDEITLDHKQPITRKGKTTRSNLCICCNTCNTLKGKLTFNEFKLVLSYPEEERQSKVKEILYGLFVENDELGFKVPGESSIFNIKDIIVDDFLIEEAYKNKRLISQIKNIYLKRNIIEKSLPIVNNKLFSRYEYYIAMKELGFEKVPVTQKEIITKEINGLLVPFETELLVDNDVLNISPSIIESDWHPIKRKINELIFEEIGTFDVPVLINEKNKVVGNFSAYFIFKNNFEKIPVKFV